MRSTCTRREPARFRPAPRCGRASRARSSDAASVLAHLRAVLGGQRRADRRDRLDHLVQFRERENSRASASPASNRCSTSSCATPRTRCATAASAACATCSRRPLDFGRISIYVLDADKHDLLGREVPPEMIAATDARGRRQPGPVGEPHAPARADRTRRHELHRGRALRGAARCCACSTVIRTRSGCMSAWRWRSAPASRCCSPPTSPRRWRASARARAASRAAICRARVGDLPFGRSAEMLALASEFDQMAARLQAIWSKASAA